MKNEQKWAALLVVAGLSAAALLADVPTYRVVGLEQLPSHWACEAKDVNNQGQVIGSCWPAPWVVTWIDGQPLQLGDGHGQAITESGTILGGGGAYEPFFWDAASGRRVLTMPNGVAWLDFAGMDDTGHVAGTAQMEDYVHRQAFRFDGQSFTFFLPTGAEQSWCRAISANGHAVVTWSGAETHGAFLYRDGEIIDLDLPGSDIAIYGINDQDVMVGRQRDEQNVEHVFKYDFPNDQWMVLSSPPDGSSAIPYAINNHAQVVGQTGTAGAALWDSDGTLYLLNELVPPELGWDIHRALTITDSGLICGGEDLFDGAMDARAFLLIPYDCAGEIIANGRIDLADLAVFLSAFGSCVGEAIFEPKADLNANGCVELDDLGEMIAKFGTSCW